MRCRAAVLLLFALFGCKTDTTNTAAAKPVELQKWGFNFSLPSEKWELLKKEESPNNDFYIFQRAGFDALPTISFQIERRPDFLTPSEIDPLMQYDGQLRASLNHIRFHSGFIWKNGPIQMQHAIGWHGSFVSESGDKRNVIMVSAANNDVLVTILCETPKAQERKIRKEFHSVLKSCNFVSKT